MWTKNDLCQLINSQLKDYLLIVVSNREPYVHRYTGQDIECIVPASGLTTALDPVMRACGGVWIAHGSGDADSAVTDANQKIRVPPASPSYELKRVWLTKEEEDGYYYGFSNQALWPLCHIVYTRPVFDEADWNQYCMVNLKFASSVLDEIKDRKAFVFIQDYHLALLPQLIKQANPDVITAQFWHIPWPNPEAFRICPWQAEILQGLLSNDLLGFHIRYHCNNFLDTVNRTLEARVDYERYEVTCNGKKTAVHPFPISIDFDEIERFARTEEVSLEMERLKKRFGIEDEFIGIGIDRFDYTKGIPDRLRAIDRFLEKYPEYQQKLVFIQAGVASRSHIEAYRNTNEEIADLEEAINWKYAGGQWKPIILLHENCSQLTLMALRRLAHFCVVSSLHDGMNLVAKEYVASRYDEDGVLILSPFTGSSRELTEALLVNPYATDHFAEAIKTALEMPHDQRRRRMRRMRQVVRENNIYKWAADMISYLLKFEYGS